MKIQRFVCSSVDKKYIQPSLLTGNTILDVSLTDKSRNVTQNLPIGLKDIDAAYCDAKGVTLFIGSKYYHYPSVTVMVVSKIAIVGNPITSKMMGCRDWHVDRAFQLHQPIFYTHSSISVQTKTYCSMKLPDLCNHDWTLYHKKPQYYTEQNVVNSWYGWWIKSGKPCIWMSFSSADRFTSVDVWKLCHKRAHSTNECVNLQQRLSLLERFKLSRMCLIWL